MRQLSQADHVLGFSIEIDPDVIEHRVADSIDAQIRDLKLLELTLD